MTRNFDPYEGFRQAYSRPRPFTAIPSICNQRSLGHLSRYLKFEIRFQMSLTYFIYKSRSGQQLYEHKKWGLTCLQVLSKVNHGGLKACAPFCKSCQPKSKSHGTYTFLTLASSGNKRPKRKKEDYWSCFYR